MADLSQDAPEAAKPIITAFTQATGFPPGLWEQPHFEAAIRAGSIPATSLGEERALQTASALLDKYFDLRATALKNLYAYVATREAPIAAMDGLVLALRDMCFSFQMADDHVSGLLAGFLDTFRSRLTPEMEKYLQAMQANVATTEKIMTKFIKRRGTIAVEANFQKDMGTVLRGMLGDLGDRKIPEQIFRNAADETLDAELKQAVHPAEEAIPLTPMAPAAEEAVDAVDAALEEDIERGLRLVKNVSDVAI
ncbi:MAG: hypothetical protein FD153_42 [Rhodospirillaceae bacterium]|nr:MAG: hypothetical protein FD153_42 [Rhodospirillaceae bacterium]